MHLLKQLSRFIYSRAKPVSRGRETDGAQDLTTLHSMFQDRLHPWDESRFFLQVATVWPIAVAKVSTAPSRDNEY